MKKLSIYLLPIALALAVSFYASAYMGQPVPPVSISPVSIIQGDPVMVTLDAESLSDVKKITFESVSFVPFVYDGYVRTLIPIDLTKKPREYMLHVEWADGRSAMDRSIVVGQRKKIEVPLGIPTKLGGNTKASQDNLVSTLSKENAKLAVVTTVAKTLWTKPFIFPLVKPIVTDDYGYNRKTGTYTIAHKGTDFHAIEGTTVKAMNRGIVRQAQTYTIYGKTIVVDHGLGLQTFYMHLSEMNVKEGDTVEQGDVIGLSGMTGYAEQPHLHLTVRINGISIDAMRFMEFFK